MSDMAAAGALRYRIVIERASETTSVYNEPIGTWGTYLTLWSRKVDVSSRERLQASEVAASVTARFLVRYNSETLSITPKDCLVYKNVRYNIVGIRESSTEGPRKFLEIDAVKRYSD